MPSPGSRSDHNSISYGSLQKGSVLSDAFSMDPSCHDLSASDWPDICNLHTRGPQCCVPSSLDQPGIKYYTPFGEPSQGDGLMIAEENERGLEDDVFSGPEGMFFQDQNIWQRDAMEAGLSRMPDQSHPLLGLPVRQLDKRVSVSQHNDENTLSKKNVSKLERFWPEIGWNGLNSNGAAYDGPDANLELLHEKIEKDFEKLAKACREQHQAHSRVDRFGQVPLGGTVSSSIFPFQKSTSSPTTCPINLPSANDRKFTSQPKSLDYISIGQGLNLPFSRVLPMAAADEFSRLPPHLRPQYLQYLKAILGLDYAQGVADKYSPVHHVSNEFWPVVPPNGLSTIFGVDGSIPHANPCAIGGNVPIFVRPGEISYEFIPPVFQFPQFAPGIKNFRYVVNILVTILKM